MKQTKRILSLLLVLCMVLSLVPTVLAQDGSGVTLERLNQFESLAALRRNSRTEKEEDDTIEFADTDEVRVSIVLETPSVLDKGFSVSGLASNAAAMEYSASLRRMQDGLTEKISGVLGNRLDVQWNLTLTANVISANVLYGQIETIKAVSDVKDVLIEPLYSVPETETDELNQYLATGMTGTTGVWSAGLTGAGSRVAILDTGLSDKHQSFNNAAWLYAMELNAKAKGMTLDDYLKSVDILDLDELTELLPKLHIKELVPELNAEDLYLSGKVPFSYNYADKGACTDHSDGVSEHGSHVAGISAANRYIPDGEGFTDAVQTVKVVGQAPDAQIINMRVFNSAGGARATDYLVAIEDAVLLGCDAVNMSLGSPSPGYTKYYNDYYDGIWQNVLKTDLVLSISMGNSYAWAQFAGANGYNYLDTPTMYTGGNPGSRSEAFTVASVNNTSDMRQCFVLGRYAFSYYEYLPAGAPNLPFITLDPEGNGKEFEYVFFADKAGMAEDFEGIDVAGKIVFLQQSASNIPASGLTFVEVHERLASLGAVAYVMCNTDPSKNYAMNLTNSQATIPGISISKGAADVLKGEATAVSDTVYTGKMTVYGKDVALKISDGGQMSSFSSWGVPGDLTLKPEITAPGGYIYSVNGIAGQTTGYESMSGTSMAAPQIAGMTALLAQYIRENDLLAKTGLTQRQLVHSLLMGTATPVIDPASGLPYSMLKQGAGRANISDAIAAGSYILVEGQPDGKVKAELGEDAERKGVYTVKLTLNNLTDAELSYFLSANVYTQDYIDGESNGQAVKYQSYSLTELEAVLSVLVNGKAAVLPEEVYGFDFDGDGDVDAADGQAILDYVTGARKELANMDKADFNGDGKITSYDAYLFLGKLSSQSVTVPANGKMELEVTVALSDEQKAALDRDYTGGAYIQTYLRFEAQSDAQGAVTSNLGMPIFAYYGSWTDAGMFDVGTRSARVTYDTENGDLRNPYIFDWNYVMITRRGNTYDEFSGNPYVFDDEYLPDRFAITFKDNTYFDGFSFVQIRHSVDSRVRIYNPDTGDVYFTASTGSTDGWYLNANSGAWVMEADEIYFTPFRGKDANGKALPEGTRVRLGFQAAPEYPGYYTIDEEGNFIVDWDKLGKGSELGVTFTIDDTAPVATSVAREMLGGEKLHVTVQDNRYVAAAFLLSKDGKLVYDRKAINQTELGAESTVTFDYSQLPGDSFMIAVADYAGNETYYSVTIEGRPARQFTEKFRGYQSGRGFVAFDTDVNKDELRASESASATSHRLVTYADGRVIAANNNGRIDIYYEEDNFSKTLTLTDKGGTSAMLDLYFDPVSESLFTRIMRVGRDSSHAGYYAKIDMDTGDVTYKYLSFFCGDEKNIRVTGIAHVEGDLYYCIDNYDKFYSFRGMNPGENELTFIADLTPGRSGLNNIQPFYYDREEKCLWWVSPVSRVLTRIEPATGETETFGTFTICPTDLWIPDYDASKDPGPHWYDPVDRLDSFKLSATKLDLMIGEAKEMTYTYKPWNTSNNALSWTSDNEAVATVQSGTILGVSEGTANITATSQLDPTRSTTVAVTVSPVVVDTYGILQDPTGKVSIFNWNFANSTAPVLGNAVEISGLNSAARTKDGKIYLNAGTNIYSVDPATGNVTLNGDSGHAYTDMTASVTFANTMYGISDFYCLYLFNPETGEIRSTFNLMTLVATRGATRVIGIAYGGYFEYEDEDNEEYYDGEFFFLIDNLGNLYKINIWEQDGKRYVQLDSVWKVEDLAIQPRHIADVDNTSLVYNAGTTSLTLSTYNGGVSEVYLLRNTANVWNAFRLGAAADETRPMALLSAGFKAEAPMSLPKSEPVVSETLSELSVEEFEAQKLERNTEYTIDEDAKTVTVTVKAPRELTNGKLVLSYDRDALALVKAESPATLFSQNGETLAFASKTGIASGETLVTLTFSYTDEAAAAKLCLNFAELNEVHDETHFDLFVDLPYTEDNCPSKRYTDSLPAWAHNAIDFVTARGYMNGIETNLFGAYQSVTRAQAVTVLYRIAGSPAVEGTTAFTDVAESQYFHNAVVWAYENGIVKGMSETSFAPYSALTREQMVTLLYRFAAYMGVEVETEATLDDFADAAKVQPYAVDAMLWAVENGIIIGNEYGLLDPSGSASRAQLAIVIERLCKVVLEAD